jgi:methionine aminopeptidase
MVQGEETSSDVPPVLLTVMQSAVGKSTCVEIVHPCYWRAMLCTNMVTLRTDINYVPCMPVQAVADARGMPTVAHFVGHGIGRAFHGG